MSAPTKATPSPDVSVAGMKPGDAEVAVTPKQGGGLVLSPLPVGGRRGKKSRKGGKSRRGGQDPMAPTEGARRRKSRKTKKGARRH